MLFSWIVQLSTTHRLAAVSPEDNLDFQPSRFFISAHAELREAHQEQRAPRWMDISRLDRRIQTSSWTQRFPVIQNRPRASTPGMISAIIQSHTN
jgi:hypothetical protein